MVEVLLHCSKESLKDAATEAAKPAAAGETGEMQVGAHVNNLNITYRRDDMSLQSGRTVTLICFFLFVLSRWSQ